MDAAAAVLWVEATAAVVVLDLEVAALAEFLFLSQADAALKVQLVATAATTRVDSSRCVTRHLPGEIAFPFMVVGTCMGKHIGRKPNEPVTRPSGAC